MLSAVPGPLDEVAVLEIASWITALSAAALMADTGASVVKVEPPTGDTMRNNLRQPSWPEGARGPAVVFQLDNRGRPVSPGEPRGFSQPRRERPQANR
jgi:crotonobetainyl-CoA:carnitine CoA-transferase CaiB-like acyl-CoA transferase